MSKESRPPISALRRELIRTLTTNPIEEVLSYAFLMKYGREFSPRTRGHGSGIVLLDNSIHHVRWAEESPDCSKTLVIELILIYCATGPRMLSRTFMSGNS